MSAPPQVLADWVESKGSTLSMCFYLPEWMWTFFRASMTKRIALMQRLTLLLNRFEAVDEALQHFAKEMCGSAKLRMEFAIHCLQQGDPLHWHWVHILDAEADQVLKLYWADQWGVLNSVLKAMIADFQWEQERWKILKKQVRHPLSLWVGLMGLIVVLSQLSQSETKFSLLSKMDVFFVVIGMILVFQDVWKWRIPWVRAWLSWRWLRDLSMGCASHVPMQLCVLMASERLPSVLRKKCIPYQLKQLDQGGTLTDLVNVCFFLPKDIRVSVWGLEDNHTRIVWIEREKDRAQQGMSRCVFFITVFLYAAVVAGILLIFKYMYLPLLNEMMDLT